MRQLWDLAEVAHERLASMTVEEKPTPYESTSRAS